MILANSLEAKTVEIELCFPNWTGMYPDDCPDYDEEYYYADRRDGGWGLVMMREFPPTADANEALVRFLTPLLAWADEIKEQDPVVLIVVYNKVATSSFEVECLPLVNRFATKLSAKIY